MLQQQPHFQSIIMDSDSDAFDVQRFYERFLERANAIPQWEVPPWYRHQLLHSGPAFADRWRLVAIDKLKWDMPSQFSPSMESIVNLAIIELVGACKGETVEIAAQGVDLPPNLYRSEHNTLFAKASIMHEGAFVGQANAFSLQLCRRLFGLGIVRGAAALLPCPSLPLYAPFYSGPSAGGDAAPASLNTVVSPQSFVSVSHAVCNRTACSLSSWLSCALVCGRNIQAGSFCSKAGRFRYANKTINRRNRKLCNRIVNAAVTCPIVIDCCSLFITAGFSPDAAPCTVLPSLLCQRQYPRGCALSLNWRPYVCGEEALKDRFAKESMFGSKLVFPIQNEVVTNWDCMEQLWQQIFFAKLKVEPANHPVLLTEAIMNPKANRERMVQIMFETFMVPALCICSRPYLCLLASSRSTGVVVQCDSSESVIVPIVDGNVLPHAIARACFHSGNDLTSYMNTLLKHRGIAGTSFECPAVHASQITWAECISRNHVRCLQEALCYVALDYDLEMQRITEATYEPPMQSGLVPAAAMSIGSERFACPEILFRPLQQSVAGMHTATDAVIKACDGSVQHRMYGNVVLAGNSLALPGMVARMEKELGILAPGVQVTVSEATKHSAWSGGATLSSLPSFLNMCILNAVYDEEGPAIVHTKCPA